MTEKIQIIKGVERIILASASPRRYELLMLLGLPVMQIPSGSDESTDKYDPEAMVMEIAARKTESVSGQYPEDLIVGADTIVRIGEKNLGKPKSEKEALAMLKELSGRSHEVYTGVSLKYGNETKNFYCMTTVNMWENDAELLKAYVKTGEPMDKAGAYGIQGPGALLIKSIEGDFYNVMGLPISKLAKEIRKILQPNPQPQE